MNENMMNATPNTATYESIAAEFSTTIGYVKRSLSAKMEHVSPMSIAGQIRTYALEHGAVKDVTGKIVLSYLAKGNFQSAEDRNERMLILRNQGYTNLEIAEKVGCALDTVSRAIGFQPEFYTEISNNYAAKIRTLQIEAREKRADALKQARIAEQQAKIAEMERKLNDDIIQFEQMKNQIEAKRKEIEEAKASLSA